MVQLTAQSQPWKPLTARHDVQLVFVHDGYFVFKDKIILSMIEQYHLTKDFDELGEVSMGSLD